MPSYLDLAVLAIVLVSALLSMLRGFSREVLAIASWAAAAAAAYWFYPLVVPYLAPYIHKEIFAQAAAAAIVFFATLIVVSLFTVRLSDAILDSKIGALDRTLGFVFGVVRGFLLAVVAFAIFNWLVVGEAAARMGQNSQDAAHPDRHRDQDRRHAAGRRGGDCRHLDQVSHEPAAGERGAGRRIGSARDDASPAVPPPAAGARGCAAEEGGIAGFGSVASDKQKLDAIINKNVPAPAPAAPAVVPKH